MKPRVQATRLFEARLANSQCSCIENLISSPNFNSRVGALESNHVFTMFLFNNEIRKDLLAEIKKPEARHNPIMNLSLKFARGGRSGTGGFSAFKRFFKPINKCFVSIRNFKNASIMRIYISVVGFFCENAHMKATFPINDTRQVGKMDRIKSNMNILLCIWISWCNHVKLLFNGTFTSIHQGIINSYRDRLSEKNPKGYAIVGPQ